MKAHVLLSAVLAVAVAACGGGGGAGSGSPGMSSAGGDITCGLANFEAEMLRLVNQHRAAGASCGAFGNFAAAPALAWDARLAAAADGHSRDMADHDYFSHTGLGGRNVGQRLSATGYAWSAVGENIAGGPRTVAEVIAGWMASPDHCVNIMNPAYRHLGVACAAAAGSTWGTYWTMVLARPG